MARSSRGWLHQNAHREAGLQIVDEGCVALVTIHRHDGRFDFGANLVERPAPEALPVLLVESPGFADRRRWRAPDCGDQRVSGGASGLGFQLEEATGHEHLENRTEQLVLLLAQRDHPPGGHLLELRSRDGPTVDGCHHVRLRDRRGRPDGGGRRWSGRPIGSRSRHRHGQGHQQRCQRGPGRPAWPWGARAGPHAPVRLVRL